ncbi:DUF1045 domain-containing protein [Microbacterium sp. NPDC096154]|uniref:DUF1045 domain-containing protein n=1 Tax=Microbacterium sp. NPDC096154 TaxID=3155549 RepID=UPI0033216C15
MTRYAVYALPGALGASDAAEAVRLRDVAEAWLAREEFRDLTVDARRYGLHGTLRAPFRLAPGRTPDELEAAARAFAARRAAVVIRSPRPRRVADFRALVPDGDHGDIDALAADIMRDFDRFRAAPNVQEVRRRRPETLPPRQRELYARWGYPFVFDEFRFHITLTDPVPAERETAVDAALDAHFDGVAGVDVPLRSIALFVEPRPGARFEVHSVHPFGDAPAAGGGRSATGREQPG